MEEEKDCNCKASAFQTLIKGLLGTVVFSFFGWMANSQLSLNETVIEINTKMDMVQTFIAEEKALDGANTRDIHDLDKRLAMLEKKTK